MLTAPAPLIAFARRLHLQARLARGLAAAAGTEPTPAPALAPARVRLLLGLLLPLAACGGGGDAPGGGGGGGEEAAAGTYRAVLVASVGGVRDTLAVMEGELALPIAEGDMASVALPAHSGRIRVTNSQWPLPYGMEDSAFLLSYREPDGGLAIYGTDFSTPRFCDVDSTDADVRAVAVAPMWASEAAGHPLSVFDVAEPHDSLGSFTVARPPGDAHATRLDAAAGAGRQNLHLYLEARWADGRERPVVLAFRGLSDGSWWASAMDRDARAVPEEGVQHYEGSLALNAERPEVYVVALDLEVGEARPAASAARPAPPAPAPAPTPATPAAPVADEPRPAPAGANATSYSAGQAVQISWGGTWYAGHILEVDGTRYKVHYDGWEERWDEWVTPDRLRPAA